MANPFYLVSTTSVNNNCNCGFGLTMRPCGCGNAGARETNAFRQSQKDNAAARRQKLDADRKRSGGLSAQTTRQSARGETDGSQKDRLSGYQGTTGGARKNPDRSGGIDVSNRNRGEGLNPSLAKPRPKNRNEQKPMVQKPSGSKINPKQKASKKLANGAIDPRNYFPKPDGNELDPFTTSATRGGDAGVKERNAERKRVQEARDDQQHDARQRAERMARAVDAGKIDPYDYHNYVEQNLDEETATGLPIYDESTGEKTDRNFGETNTQSIGLPPNATARGGLPSGSYGRQGGNCDYPSDYDAANNPCGGRAAAIRKGGRLGP